MLGGTPAAEGALEAANQKQVSLQLEWGLQT